MKIINVLKDDSLADILDIFRQAPAGEVILVLPRVGKLFRTEDHFAAFASEASQGGKTVSLLTGNPTTAQLARKFGFAVMASNATKKPTSKKKTKAAPKAQLATAPFPGDPDVQDFGDNADLGDVVLPSDQTMGSTPSDADEVDPLHGMTLLDEEGNPVDENEDGEPDQPDNEDLMIGDDAELMASDGSAPTATLAASVDGVRQGAARKNITPSARAERPTKVPVQRSAARDDLDYIDAMWRDKIGRAAARPLPAARFGSRIPSFFAKMTRMTGRSLGSVSASKKIAAGMLGGAIIILGAVVYLVTGSANVRIVPVAHSVDAQYTVQASDVFSTIDDTFLKIPGQLLEVSKTQSATISASGMRDVASKARGTITISNEYSSSPQTLVATTRFRAEDGHIFRTLQSVVVPGSTLVAGKSVPGTVRVEVIADKPGPEYNVPAGTFTIAAFLEKGDTEKAKKLYGTSSQAMSGGASGPSKVVTQADYDQAKSLATAGVKEQIKAALAAQGGGLLVIQADAPAFNEAQSTAKPDDAADAVTVTMSARLKTIAFRESDLHELIRRFSLKKDRLVVDPARLAITYGDVQFKEDMGILSFTLALTGSGYQPLDIEAIQKDVAGKKSAGIREYFQGKAEVQSATATLSPFWVRTAPKNPARIRVDIVFPEDGSPAPEESR
ncbi:MAG: baseplate J/gp47 family protein [Candidatus Yanofskybacteria bacterium]|nr:baseplate J/gp47 family protein [Candidatus Yanofskybacteria bacterium]